MIVLIFEPLPAAPKVPNFPGLIQALRSLFILGDGTGTGVFKLASRERNLTPEVFIHLRRCRDLDIETSSE